MQDAGDRGLFRLHYLLEHAGGSVLDWGGRETNLPLGFAVLRLQANSLWCYASVPFVAPSSRGHHSDDAVQMLCRALRMAPACYRHIELVAADEEQRLDLVGGHHVWFEDQAYLDSIEAEANFDSIAELAAAMRHIALAGVPELSVLLSSDERTIIVHRIESHACGTGLPGGIVNV